MMNREGWDGRGNLCERFQAKPFEPSHATEALAHERSVHSDQRHDIRHRRKPHEIHIF